MAMGMTPRQVDALTLWEFNACLAGWSKANGAGEQAQQAPTDAEDEALRIKYADA